MEFGNKHLLPFFEEGAFAEFQRREIVGRMLEAAVKIRRDLR
jgi:hypothetical protein